MHVLQNARITCFLVHKCEWLGKRDVFEDVVVTDGRQVLDLTYIQPLIAFRLWRCWLGVRKCIVLC